MDWTCTSIRLFTALTTTVALAFAGTPAIAHPTKHHTACHTLKCKRAWGRKHHWVAPRPPGEHRFISNNVTCYHEGSITADGSGVYVGEVASNSLPLGTRIHFDHPVFGLSVMTVHDHIGSGSELDIYGPSQGDCESFGRQSLGFSVLR